MEQAAVHLPALTGNPFGIACLAVFVLAYLAVMGEEVLKMRKSIPMMVAAGLMWAIVGWAYSQLGHGEGVTAAARRNILDFGELFLFLLAAMTFVNTLEERGVFDALRAWLLRRGFSLRTLFWVTGALAFIISPFADNLTTALVVGAVVMAVGQGNSKFINAACVNIVVAANAGGAFSPFGDITTLMVWQSGLVPFQGFFRLFLPALVNWLVPAAIMALFIGKEACPQPTEAPAGLQPGAGGVLVLFALTIAAAVLCHSLMNLPPVIGMMAGLGVLKLYSYFLERRMLHRELLNEPDDVFAESQFHAVRKPLDVFKQLERAEWDTLMFFYGVIMGVGALGTLGYLALASAGLYGHLGATPANVLVGLLSAVVDNIPVMFAVLSMNPPMPEGQWLLVTMTAGVGGSLLSIGSAAGVALMGQSRRQYTFLSHLKWAWAVALGYAASIGVHLLINRALFETVGGQ